LERIATFAAEEIDEPPMDEGMKPDVGAPLVRGVESSQAGV
jgi:hypothetical protein